MATVRDPMFWKRFSAAIHLDEEAATGRAQHQQPEEDKSTSTKSRPKLDHAESWLEREMIKKRRQSYMCWGFWFGFLGFVAGIVVLIVWLDRSGVFHKLNEMTEPQSEND
ncbi:hypothetical protein MPH_09789 [Macrophomina phaseolina MS6]|uniref:Transmembrane protein n=1 Tax=Macrophomina phaseolina (strain MS6) TaxID=1126212 RepID=K2RS63_MACPH|nr:hypothetical protein MPH_09789 [Macrophomina phaseolina MS6]